MGEVHRLVPSETVFGLQAAGRLLNKIFAPWVQDLALLVEGVEAVRPPGALPDWQPGAVVRLPFSNKNCCDGEVVCSQALMALADTAMVIACSAAWNGYRPMSTIDQTTHFLRPVNFDVIADARVVRIGAIPVSAASCCSEPQTKGRSAWWRARIQCFEKSPLDVSADDGTTSRIGHRRFQFRRGAFNSPPEPLS
jgi:acyl-coenzyme A thioesterase PaaI-like protein